MCDAHGNGEDKIYDIYYILIVIMRDKTENNYYSKLCKIKIDLTYFGQC